MWCNFKSKLVNKIFSYFIYFIKMSLSFRNEWRMIELKETKEDVEFKIIIATKIHKNLKKAICGLVRQFFIVKAFEESTMIEQDITVQD